MSTASRPPVCAWPVEDVPPMWKVLVYRIERAEREERIAADWEDFVFGISSRATTKARVEERCAAT